MPGDCQALLGIPDIELFYILKIMCDMAESPQANRKCDSKTLEQSSTLSCKANTDWQSRSDNANVIRINSNMLDHFRSSTSREADKKRKPINDTKNLQ